MTPSEQARADAIADATTLRLAVRPSSATAEEAYRLGGWVIAHLANHVDRGEAVRLAVAAAHAAFRAVPGLRDDK